MKEQDVLRLKVIVATMNRIASATGTVSKRALIHKSSGLYATGVVPANSICRSLDYSVLHSNHIVPNFLVVHVVYPCFDGLEQSDSGVSFISRNDHVTGGDTEVERTFIGPLVATIRKSTS